MIFRWITSSSVGMESISVRIMAQASSMRSMALSGRKRSVIYRLDRVAAAMMAPSVDLHPVEHLVPLLQAAEDGDGVLHRGLAHHHRLEPPLQGGVLLDILAVLVEGGGADAVELAPGQHGLEQVAGVHGPLGLARPHDGVELVDEEDDAAPRTFSPR